MQTETEFRVAQASSAIQAYIRAAQAMMRRDRQKGLAALDEIFRAGLPPDSPLNGYYGGELVALNIAPGLTQLTGSIAQSWMPWQGKRFSSASGTGVNVFTRDSLTLAHLYWPFYHGYEDDTANTYRAFAFRTYLAPGLADPDRTVLKIDYDRQDNPAATIRRVLDELVQVSDDCYLGKAHMHWWWNRWQLVAYFMLAKPARS